MNTAYVLSADPARKPISVSHTNVKPAADDYHIERNVNINEHNLTGFCIIFAFFIGGLITNAIIASKIIAIGPFVLPASVFIWALTYPCSDIVAEVYGRKYAHKMVLGGYIAFIMMYIIVYEAVAMPAAPFWEHQEAFETVLGASKRVMAAALISYGITQFFDVHLFGVIKRKTNGRYLWLRNNLSTFTSQTLANTIFLTIAFLGVFPMEKWIHLFVANLLARYALAVVDTSVVYSGVHALYRFYPELKAGARKIK